MLEALHDAQVFPRLIVAVVALVVNQQRLGQILGEPAPQRVPRADDDLGHLGAHLLERALVLGDMEAVECERGGEGFEVVGDGFVDATTQLPHHVVVSVL